MKKIGKFFTLMALTFIFLMTGVFSSCFLLPEKITPPGPYIEKLLLAYEQRDYVAIEADMDIALTTNFNGFDITSDMHFLIKENLRTKEGDYSKTRGARSRNNIYFRGDEAYEVNYTVGGKDEETASKKLIATDPSFEKKNFFERVFKSVGLDKVYKMGAFEKKDLLLMEMKDLFAFAEKYDAVIVKDNVVTYDVNRLVYNIVRKLAPIFRGINKNTTLGEVFEKEPVKELIKNIAGGYSATRVYTAFENFLQDHVGNKQLPSKMKDFKPQKGQGFYTYITELLHSNEFLRAFKLYEYFDGLTLADVRVYELFGYTDEDAKIAFDDFMRAINGVRKNQFALEFTFKEEGDFTFILKDFVIGFELDGDRLASHFERGELVFDDELVTDLLFRCKMDLHEKYFQEEQTLTDLTQFKGKK